MCEKRGLGACMVAGGLHGMRSPEASRSLHPDAMVQKSVRRLVSRAPASWITLLMVSSDCERKRACIHKWQDLTAAGHGRMHARMAVPLSLSA
jgi:hypothetical protein